MNQTYLLLFVVLTLLMAACDKGVCISGIVLDNKSGKPISGAKIVLHYEYQESGSLKSNRPTVSTNYTGAFSFTAEQRNSYDLGIYEVRANGYSSAFTAAYSDGKCADVTVKLTPLDGLLKLTISNETGTNDTIYAGVFNKCEYRRYFLLGISYTEPYPLVLQKGERYTKTFYTCMGDSSAVLRRFSKNDPWIGTDSVLVNTADTMFFEIKY